MSCQHVDCLLHGAFAALRHYVGSQHMVALLFNSALLLLGWVCAATVLKSALPFVCVQKLLHTMETLKTFMSLGVDVPHSSSDVPKTIEAVEAKKKGFEELRDKYKDAPPEEEPEEEPEDEEVPDEAPEAPALANGNGIDENMQSGSSPAANGGMHDDEWPVAGGKKAVKSESDGHVGVTLVVGDDAEGLQLVLSV